MKLASNPHPKALRLADALQRLNLSLSPAIEQAAAELRRLHAEVEELNLAEEGAKEAFGDVVLSKRDLETKCREQERQIRSINDLLRTVLLRRNELLAMLEKIDKSNILALLDNGCTKSEVRAVIAKAMDTTSD